MKIENHYILDESVFLEQEDVLTYVGGFPNHEMSLFFAPAMNQVLTTHRFPDHLILRLIWNYHIRPLRTITLKELLFLRRKGIMELDGFEVVAPSRLWMPPTEEMEHIFLRVKKLKRKVQPPVYEKLEGQVTLPLRYPDFFYEDLIGSVSNWMAFESYYQKWKEKQ